MLWRRTERTHNGALKKSSRTHEANIKTQTQEKIYIEPFGCSTLFCTCFFTCLHGVWVLHMHTATWISWRSFEVNVLEIDDILYFLPTKLVRLDLDQIRLNEI
jgi:hypothetical protein